MQSVLLGVEESPTRVVTGVVLPESLHLDVGWLPRQMFGVAVTVSFAGSGIIYITHPIAHIHHMWTLWSLLLEVEVIYICGIFWF